MNTKLTIAALFLLGQAGAVSTSLPNLIRGSGGQLRVSAGAFLVSKRTADLTFLTLGIGQSASTATNRANAVFVLAAREYLKPTEQALFSKTISQVVLKCFNLSPARGPAITAWLDAQNLSPLRNVTALFGPMTMQFQRYIADDGTYWTKVSMQRSGVPGAAPWVNYCRN